MKILFFLIIYFCLQFGKWDNSNGSILVANGQGGDQHCIKKPAAAASHQTCYTKTLKNRNNIGHHGVSRNLDLKTSRSLASAFGKNEFWYKFTRLLKCLVEKLLQKSENLRQSFFHYYYPTILVLLLFPVFSKLSFMPFSTEELDFMAIINLIAFVFLGPIIDIFVKNNKLAKSAKFTGPRCIADYIAANTFCWMLYTHPLASICFLFMTLFVNPATFRLNSISYFTTIMLIVYHISAAIGPYYPPAVFGILTFLINLTNSSWIDANSFVLILQKSAPETQLMNILNLPCLAIIALVIQVFTATVRLQGLFTYRYHLYLALFTQGFVLSYND